MAQDAGARVWEALGMPRLAKRGHREQTHGVMQTQGPVVGIGEGGAATRLELEEGARTMEEP